MIPLLSLLSVLGTFVLVAVFTQEKRGISDDVYNDLVYYFKYASSAYANTCAHPNGNTLIKEFSNWITDTQGFVARDDDRKEIIVAMRGTVSLEDYLVDLDILFTDFTSPGASPPSGTSVHSGFLGAWNSVASGVISTLNSELSNHPDYTIVTTGHSLGAALSSIAGITLKQNFPSNPIRMYTFGQPRTGNHVYASWVNDEFGANAFRAVHTTDGVPTMLPTFLGYQHHGVEYWQNPDPPSAAHTKQCNASGEDPTCSASILSQGINSAHKIYFGIPQTMRFCSITGGS